MTCSVCWTILCAACLYIIARPDSFHEPPVSLPSPWASQKERIWWMCVRGRARCFHPLVLSSTGSFGREATTFYKCLVDLINSKWQLKHFSNVISCQRYHLSIAILRSVIVSVAVVHLTTVRGVRWISPSPHLKDYQCNSIVTKTLPSRVLLLLFDLLPFFCHIIQGHCITQFTLCRPDLHSSCVHVYFCDHT